MKIRSIKIDNYKSFYIAEPIYFAKGINLIIGKNNAGKSSLLDTLSLNFKNNPHRSIINLAKKGLTNTRSSNVKLEISISGTELLMMINELQANMLDFPMPRDVKGTPEDQNVAKEFIGKINNIIKENSELIFNLSYSNGALYKFSSDLTPTFQKGQNRKIRKVSFEREGNRLIFSQIKQENFIDNLSIWHLNFKKRIFIFNAERLNISQCNNGISNTLQPNASNLAEVLNYLQQNYQIRFKKFNQYVKSIFPDVHGVGVKNINGNKLQIFTINHDPHEERTDLNISLNNCGTGLSQVLAMLYIIINKDIPKTIIIDEPMSFLHPGAARKLMDVIQEYPQHNYIITTHSPTIISSCNPSTIGLLKLENSVSKYEKLDLHESQSLQLSLSELGVKLSDVFGADSIIWVEGPTEEKVFDLIIKKIIKKIPSAISVQAVVHTGDFDSRRKPKTKELIIKIYNKLSKGNALIPPSIAFIFDKELRKDREINDLKRMGPIEFLPRRTFENYILDSEILNNYIQKIEGFDNDKMIDLEKIQAWINSNNQKREYWIKADKPKKFENDEWKKMIDAPLLLDNLFKELSENRVTYRKTLDSVAISNLIVETKPELFNDIVEILKEKTNN